MASNTLDENVLAGESSEGNVVSKDYLIDQLLLLKSRADEINRNAIEI